MSDVARKARVSESTVSRVLSGSETPISISDATRQRVLAAVHELNYQPNPFARALRGKNTNLIGLIVRQVDDPFFSELIEVIGSEASAAGFDLVLGYKSDPQEALQLGQMLELRHSDGLFLMGDLDESPEDYTFLAEMGKDHALVSLCRGNGPLSGSAAHVGLDNAQGVQQALEYLVSLGHRDIAFLGTDRLGDLRERMEAYSEFMKKRFGDGGEEYIQVERNSFEGGYAAAKTLFSTAVFPSAILASDDTMAIGAMAAALDLGMQVGDDISIVGFDGIRLGTYVRPALTTVRQPIEKIGKKAVEMLVAMINGNGAGQITSQVLFEPELVIRQSCGSPGH
jgi:DNA-binding LacI/PurR family transcriptional regulator